MCACRRLVVVFDRHAFLLRDAEPGTLHGIGHIAPFDAWPVCRNYIGHNFIVVSDTSRRSMHGLCVDMRVDLCADIRIHMRIDSAVRGVRHAMPSNARRAKSAVSTHTSTHMSAHTPCTHSAHTAKHMSKHMSKHTPTH